MKLILINILILLPVVLHAQQSVYAIKFKDVNNQEINMSNFAGKRILVLTVDASDPDRNQLSSLDTLYKRGQHNLVIIAIPVEDFGDSLSNTQLRNIFINELHLTYILARSGKGKKVNGDNQHKLLKWLTNKQENQHMDRDVEEPGQMFVINEAGMVYANMKRKIVPTGQVMEKILSQQFR